jgi:hypothetical protein|tara:strand:+ start:211 stop:441 length:231 start_codon:yes stop_codon:yes gene_type:complete
MSDSIKKYQELVEQGKIDPKRIPLKDRDDKIMGLLAEAAKQNKLAAVQIRATEVQKMFGGASLLLGLQVACDELLN